MSKKGASFTLSMVVAIVILILTAVSIITLSEGSISKFFGWVGGTQSETAEQGDIRQACLNLANEVNQNYCNLYVSGNDPNSAGDCQSVKRNKDVLPSSEDGDGIWRYTASETNCGWNNVDQISYAEASSASPPDLLTDTADTSHAPIVEVGGSTYHCVEEGYWTSTSTCPVETVETN